MKRLFISSCVLMMALSSAHATDQLNVKPLLDLEKQLDDGCRDGSGDDPNVKKLCIARDAVDQQLHDVGYCYGKKGQFGYQMIWHKCGPDSLK